MFEAFSTGYYFGRLYVEPTTGDHAVMQRAQHEQVNEQVYASGEGVERLDAPLVMKLDTTHFPVLGDETVPENTLRVPESLLAESDVDRPPELTEVFLAKRAHAARLLRWTGGWEPAVGT